MIVSPNRKARSEMKVRRKSVVAISVGLALAAMGSSSLMAVPLHHSFVAANVTTSPGSSKFTIQYPFGWDEAAPAGAWTSPTVWSPSLPTPIPIPVTSPQKTLGASRNRQAIMYRVPGVNVVQDVSFGRPLANSGSPWTVAEYGDNGVTLGNGNAFDLLVEEIEIEPVSNDIFALATDVGNVHKIFRIDKDTNVAEPMITTLWASPNAPGPYGPNLYKGISYQSGSITFMPDPANSGKSLLVFTHVGTLYGLCVMLYRPNGLYLQALNAGTEKYGKCKKPIAATGFPVSGAGVNSVFIEGQLVIARDNGPFFKVTNVFAPSSPTVWPLVSPVPMAGSSTALNSDFAWIRDQWRVGPLS